MKNRVVECFVCLSCFYAFFKKIDYKFLQVCMFGADSYIL